MVWVWIPLLAIYLLSLVAVLPTHGTGFCLLLPSCECCVYAWQYKIEGNMFLGNTVVCSWVFMYVWMPGFFSQCYVPCSLEFLFTVVFLAWHLFTCFFTLGNFSLRRFNLFSDAFPSVLFQYGVVYFVCSAAVVFGSSSRDFFCFRHNDAAGSYGCEVCAPNVL